jgi:cytochrome P450
MAHLHPWTLSSIFWALILLFLLYALYQIILRPYLIIRFYKEQGGVGYYSPTPSYFVKMNQYSRAKGDCLYWFKKQYIQNPTLKFFTFNFKHLPLLYLVDPAYIKAFSQKNDVYEKHGSTVGFLTDICAESVFFVEGNNWKSSRKSLSSSFNYQYLRESVPMIVEIVQEKFNGMIKTNNLNQVNILQIFGIMSGEIVAGFFFGKNDRKKLVEGKTDAAYTMKIGHQIMRYTFSPWTMLFGRKLIRAGIFPKHRKFIKSIKDYKREINKIIAEARKSETKEHCLLTTLFELDQNDPDTKFTDEKIADEFIGLFGAGTDTTSHLTALATYYLWKYPEVFKKVKEEVDREFADVAKVDLDSLNRMEYLTAFIKEVLRIVTPVPFLLNRIATADHYLEDLKIKKGTLVSVGLGVLQTSDKYYSEPSKFIPERFLPNGPYPNDEWKKEPFAYIPFMAGPRNCLGQYLAMMEVKIILSLYVKMFKFELPKDYVLRVALRFTTDAYDPLRPNLTPI